MDIPVDELYTIVSRWYGEGVISDTDRQRLRSAYLAELGTTTCTTCPDFWRDVQHHYRYFLKSQNRIVMSPNNKYMVADSVGSLFIAGIGLVVNAKNIPGTIALTDELATAIFGISPDFKEYIIENPDYVAPVVTEAKKKEDVK